MSTAALPSQAGIRCYYRPILLAIGLMIIMGVFWFVSRYPQLMHKSTQLGNEMSSMANTGNTFKVAADAPWYAKIGWGAMNWLDTMKKGMTFGVLSGALLHTILKYYPLKIGQNLYLNSLKGALVGVPAGVCANCSVPRRGPTTRRSRKSALRANLPLPAGERSRDAEGGPGQGSYFNNPPSSPRSNCPPNLPTS